MPWQEVKRQRNADGTTSSVWEKWFAFRGDPPYLSLLGRYDPGMIVRRHGHRSPHVVYVHRGLDLVRRPPVRGRAPTSSCPRAPPSGRSGPDPTGVTMFEVMLGDPRSWGDQPELVDALRAEHGVEELPDPEIDLPDWLADERARWASGRPMPVTGCRR